MTARLTTDIPRFPPTTDAQEHMIAVAATNNLFLFTNETESKP